MEWVYPNVTVEIYSQAAKDSISLKADTDNVNLTDLHVVS